MAEADPSDRQLAILRYLRDHGVATACAVRKLDHGVEEVSVCSGIAFAHLTGFPYRRPLAVAAFRDWTRGEPHGMEIVAFVLVVVMVVLIVGLVLGMFIWAAAKDGQEDKAVQARLGLRRRTRLGR